MTNEFDNLVCNMGDATNSIILTGIGWAMRCVVLVTTITAIVGLASRASGAEAERIRLWESGAPGEPATQAEDEPALFVFRPAAENATETAVVVCPGGSYRHLAMDHEGEQIARWLNSLGVTACVLKYRHNASGHKHPAPMLDGQRAVRTVRARAGEWKIDPAKIGVMGFSAGGHLASTLATHFDAGDAKAADTIDRVSSRPDFLILCYPVITMSEPYMHRGSRDNLLGNEPNFALEQLLSNDRQVSPQTPPTFIFQTDEDKAVPAENCVSFYLALRRAGVPAEMHIYEKGQHGVGLAKDIPGTKPWPERCREWMKNRGLL